MLIELDLDLAKVEKLKVNQIILLKFIVDGEKRFPYTSVVPITIEDINELIERQILKPESVFNKADISNLFLTDEYLSEIKGDFFDEFYALYPVVVSRTDGTKDYLRGDVTRCRRAYNKIVGKSKRKHAKIMRALSAEVLERTRTNKMSFMKRMSKWIAAEEWILNEDTQMAAEAKGGSAYGTAIE